MESNSSKSFDAERYVRNKMKLKTLLLQGKFSIKFHESDEVNLWFFRTTKGDRYIISAYKDVEIKIGTEYVVFARTGKIPKELGSIQKPIKAFAHLDKIKKVKKENEK